MSASAGSPDFEKVPDIPSNDFEDEDDRVCDMEVGSEWTEDPRRVSPDDEEEDEDVEMASEGVTESGLESYGNPDEDDFPEDERLDNLNRVQQCLPLPSAQVPQWDPTPHNYSSDPWTQQPAPASPLDPANVAACGQTMSDSGGLTLQAVHSSCVPQTYEELHVYNASSGVESRSELGERQSLENVNRAPPAPPLPSAQGTQWDRPNLNSACDPGALAAPTSPSTVQQRSDSEALAQSTSPASVYPQEKDALHPKAQSSIASAVYSSSDTSTSDELQDYNSSSGVGSLSNMSKLHSPTSAVHTHALDDQDRGVPLETSDGAETPPADDNPRGPTVACVSDSSSSSTTEDEASDMEGEAQLDEPVEDQGIDNAAFIGNRPAAQRSLSALEEGEETCMVVGEGGLETPHSADSVASYAFDMTASNSNSHSTADGCPKSPGIFSLEELPKEDKDQSVIQELTLPSPQLQPGSAEPLVSSSGEQHYMHCGDVDAELGDRNDVKPLDTVLFVAPQHPGGGPCDTQPPYYSIICDNTENSPSGLGTLPQSHLRREYHHTPNPHCDLLTPPRLTCADLPPRSPHLQASPQLRRLEQHKQQLLEMQQRREQQGRPHKENAGEEERRKDRERDKEMKKREAEEERLRREEQETQRRDRLQQELQKQQEELKQRQQILQWQQELKGQAQETSQKGQSTALLSPSSGLHTIYEALEIEGEEEQETGGNVGEPEEARLVKDTDRSQDVSDEERVDSDSASTLSPPPDSPEQAEPCEASPHPAPVSPECPSPPPLDLDWGKKVDIVQQLINQTLLLTGDGCSSLIMLPGGGGGTLSPLEASLWPNLLPPLTPPSATVTSVSSFSPEAPGQSQQGEWTVVELETHH
ncbi:hypothetical protein DPEC_G00176560 [Dallia pectoralis]|uniref:Uncharacterized protein n=1 Tax=Dallia pectoralis TaxID=75939 RepID=A0ACC2GF41_DALPE|nr:hypothetical protein DPEC_G00176560 [Dallia pectoralis]